ncbi:hypothetical protein ACFQ9H_19600 [Streptomyces sp. NPDC056517]|uniref:hypothetical protein n=1 Tax=Streptomyces sp. NPDC056517 TaxID=3345848 RepID=UPI0036945F74
MANPDPYGQGIQIAALADAPDAETLAHGIVDAVAPRLNLRFASAAARAAQLVGAAAPVAGMLTYLLAEDRYDVRMADGTWQALSPGAWIPLTFASGYAARTGLPSYRIVNGSVEMRGTFQRSAGGAFSKGVTFTVMTLPAAARPTSYRYFLGRTEWAADMQGGIEVAPDGTVNVGIPNTAGTAASWMALDQVRYSLT